MDGVIAEGTIFASTGTLKHVLLSDGSWPGVTEDASRTVDGNIEQLASGLTVYTVPPPSESTKGVVINYDVHGFKGGRVKSVCDAIARAGFWVCMPDVYGDGVGVNDFGGFASDTGKAFLKTHSFESLLPKLNETIDHLKSKGVETVGTVGFCWGAWVVFKLSATCSIHAGASVHPSTRIGPLLWSETEGDMARAVKAPQLLLPAGNDPENLKTGGEIVEIIRGSGLACETHEFPDMSHGWSIRGDATDPAVARDVRAAVEKVCTFFKAHL